ncbi:MAG: protease, partial [Planctomycetota bacterium]
MFLKHRLAFVLLLVFSCRLHAETRLGYFRHPALHEETIVFVAEGDLWSVSVDGGAAHRITSHAGEENHPCISPDGKLLAFAAEYEGSTEVYTMPVNGGRPQRQTVEAEASIPVAWTPDGRLVYTTQHFSTLPANQLIAINLESKTRTRIPLSQASDAAYDSNQNIYFVRPRFHRQQVKRYQGGTARNIWKFENGADEATILTEQIHGEAHSPWWFQDRVYFVTDSDGTMNIWSMTSSGDDLQQHTRHSGFDVKRPSLHAGRMVYQVGADLWMVDLETNVQRKLDITLVSDFDQLRDKWITNPMDRLSSSHIHPAGESVVLVSRGRLFVAPAKGGRLVQASRKSNVRFRDACFAPDGESILSLSDESDEFEFWRFSARGLGGAE